MRSLLAGEFNIATAGDTAVDIDVKLEAQNGSGTWIDIGASIGKRWVINAAWGETTDQAVSQATFTLVQRVGVDSLAPLMSTSPLNVLDDGVTYSPLLNIGRLIRASSATTAKGVAPTTEYRRIFDGRIDTVDIADSVDQQEGPVTLTCSSQDAWLMDCQIETSGTQYGTSPVGTALETVIQNILTAVIPGGEPAVTLVKESASTFAVTDYKLPDSMLLEALTGLVLDSTGEDLRYRYNASHVSTFQWFNPDRSRVTVDATFGANTYLLRALDLSIANIRNAGAMPWTNPTTGASGTSTVTDSTSTGLYRRRFFRLPGSSMIISAAEATAVLTAAVNDLSEPPGEAQALCPYLWFVQLYDRYTFTANNRQFDQNQTFGVVAYQHSIQNGIGSTTLTLTARIMGAYAAWLKRLGGGIVAGNNAPTAVLSFTGQTDRDINLTADVVADPAQLPVTWAYRLKTTANPSPAWIAGAGALPQLLPALNRSTFKQASVELMVTQLDGKVGTTSYVAQGEISGVIHGAASRVTEDDARSGTGGVPISRSRLRPDVVYSADGTTPLIDTVAGRFETALSGPTGIAGDIIERGGNKGDNALNGSYNLQTGVDAGALGSDGYAKIESRRGAAKQASHASGGVTEGYNRGGFAGVPTRDGMFIAPPVYDVTGTQLIIDPATIDALSPFRSLGSAKAAARMTQNLQTFTNNNPATIVGYTADFDVGGLTDTVNGKIVIPADYYGLWVIVGSVVWDSNATGRRKLEIDDNGGPLLNSLSIVAAVNGDATCQLVLAFLKDPVGNAYKLRGFQTSGGNLNVSATLMAFHIW